MDIVTHEQPPDADFLLHIDLADHGLAGRREQIWVKQVGEFRFVVRSLPYFAYGIRPGDEVSTDETYIVQSVTVPSGLHLMRVAVERESAKELHDELHGILARCALTHEWRGSGYVSVALDTAEVPDEVAAWIDQVRTDGHQVHVEFG